MNRKTLYRSEDDQNGTKSKAEERYIALAARADMKVVGETLEHSKEFHQRPARTLPISRVAANDTAAPVP